MADLSSKFTRRDVEILLEAVGDWESQGMHEWQFAKYIKEIPLPPEDHEAYELVKSAKEHFSKREQNIADRKDAREEEAIFLKAKLLLNRKQMNMDSLFEMPLDTSAPPPVVEVVPAKVAKPVENDNDSSEVAELREKLRLAEFYIQDLGVTKMYEEFLEDRKKEKLEESK